MKLSGDVAVLWSGGKDCCLALHEIMRRGLGVRCLVTFAPPSARFLAHPLEVMSLQAQAMGIEHRLVRIAEPYETGYRAAISGLASEGIKTIVTGDIAEVAGQPNWVRQCAEGSGVEVLTPLWHASRDSLMDRLVSDGITAVISAVRGGALDENWLGRVIDEHSLAAMRELRQRSGMDLCGENGEYHTMVVDAPAFGRAVRIEEYLPCRRDDLVYMEIRKVCLADKPAKNRPCHHAAARAC